MIFPEIHIYYSAQRVFDALKCLLTFNNTFLPFFGIEAFTSMFEFYLLRWIKFEFDFESNFAGLLKLLIEGRVASLLQQ